MSPDSVDPSVQAVLDEVAYLPDCAAQVALLERAAVQAELLGDLKTAWDARCRILQSTEAMSGAKFRSLLLPLGWCVAMSDRDPTRFDARDILWQYKWVVSAAMRYAAVPLDVITGLISDMSERFVRAGWGRRAGLHARVALALHVGDIAAAADAAREWQAVPRDRGSDCVACESSTLVELLISEGRLELAAQAARPFIRGRLSCAEEPHQVFGDLLGPLTILKRDALARELYERGRRLVASVEHGVVLTADYLEYAAFRGLDEHVAAFLRARFGEGERGESELQTFWWRKSCAVALDLLADRGVRTIEFRRVRGEGVERDVRELAADCRRIAAEQAALLDARNGNTLRRDELADATDYWRRLRSA